jgi:hypothetical protein
VEHGGAGGAKFMAWNLKNWPIGSWPETIAKLIREHLDHHRIRYGSSNALLFAVVLKAAHVNTAR